MGYFKKFFGHLKTVLTHKHWVFYYASNLGYTWRGLTHDLSKFSPVEFFESVKYWTGKRSPILAVKETVGIAYSWLHHKGRNKHHYEYWVDRVNGELIFHKIPFNYTIEMVCDWLAACRTYSNNGADVFSREYEWWKKHVNKVSVNEDTKYLVSKLLWNLKEQQEANGLTEKQALRAVAKMLPDWKRIYNDPKNKHSDHYEDTHL